MTTPRDPTASRNPDQLIRAFLDEGPMDLRDQVYDEVRSEVDRTDQRTTVGPWRNLMATRFAGFAAVTAVVAGAVIVGLALGGGGPLIGGDPTLSPSAPPSEPSGPSPSVSTSSAYDSVMNGFVAARVAGEGAEQYLDLENTRPEDIPLLYATTTGAPYQRGEFEQVAGIEWPYGWEAFRVRLFAGDTVVEQLIFAGPDTPGLNYQGDGFGTDIPPTTEDGEPVAMPKTYFDGQVTLRAAHPWIMSDYSDSGGSIFGRLIPEGPGVPPTTDGGQRHDGWDELFLIADPKLGGAGCQASNDPVDAAALAESIRSNPDLDATDPIAVSVGGADALMMDVRIPAGASVTVPAGGGGDLCQNGLLLPVFDLDGVGSEIRVDDGIATSQATGDWMRLYLLAAPEGSSMRILALTIVAPESRFERAVEEAAPILESVEFHVP